jgi:hypothetical protein
VWVGDSEARDECGLEIARQETSGLEIGRQEIACGLEIARQEIACRQRGQTHRLP